jgi:hypothetical protein
MNRLFFKILEKITVRAALVICPLLLITLCSFPNISSDGFKKQEDFAQNRLYGKILGFLEYFTPALHAQGQTASNEPLTLPKTLSSSESNANETGKEEEVSVWRVAIPEEKEAPKAPKETVPKTATAPKPTVTEKKPTTPAKPKEQTKTAEATKPAETSKPPIFKANSKLIIPKDTKDLAFLEGCWDYRNLSAFSVKKIRYLYCFNKNGTAVTYIDEYDIFGKIERKCVGKVEATLSGGVLSMVDKEVSCPGPHNFEPEAITCKMVSDVKVRCSVRDLKRGNSSEATFTYTNYKR